MSIAIRTKLLPYLGAALLVACQGTMQSKEFAVDSRPIAGSQAFNLSGQQLTELERATRDGDAKAAYRLALYYEFVRLDSEGATAYLNQSANLGNVQAKSFLGAKLLQSDDPGRRKEGIRWLKEAVEGGDTNALDILNRMHE